MQEPSEFGITEYATLKDWYVSKEIHKIIIPTLTIVATYYTINPQQMNWISTEVKNGRFLLCPNGSHLFQFDDQEIFF